MNTESSLAVRDKDVLSRLDVLPEWEGAVADTAVESLNGLGRQRQAVQSAAEQLGARGIPLGQSFACPLVNHHGEASFYLDRLTGVWKMHCWCTKVFLTLGETRAAIAYGVTRRISNIEAAIWYLRLWAEARVVVPKEITLAPAPNGPAYLQAVRTGFALLVGLRWLSYPGQPVTFTREFAVAWCDAGITAMQGYGAICALEDAAVIVCTNADVLSRRTPKLWLPAIRDRTAPR